VLLLYCAHREIEQSKRRRRRIKKERGERDSSNLGTLLF
jgi:hypothetical protein